MNLKIGIVGMPNVGKSTLFNALTKNNILAANYPFATIEPNTGIVSVPDERLLKLSELYQAERVVPATVEFVDIAGLVAGASNGEGLGNKFLSHIRECAAIAQVVRAFENDDIVHVANNVDPQADIEVIRTELALADIATLERRIGEASKRAKADPKQQVILDLYNNVLEKLKKLEILDLGDEEQLMLSDLHLLSVKPVIYIFNLDENELIDEELKKKLASMVTPHEALFVSAKLEDELKNLDDTEAQELLSSYGVEKSGLIQIINSAYRVLNLQSFLTAGKQEVRAWTIKKGSTAPQAAGAIHGDFERGFIAASIIDYNDLIAAGSENEAKAQGKVRTEGKSYIMKEGDVVEFRFNV